ncbi:carbamoyltransferase HypF [Ruminococcus sp. AF18-22]|nr:carbamoyltransferase HypF [Ruminococcus sp. AF18-22]
MEKQNQQHVKLHIKGIVQGVGFRPFLHRLASRYSLHGWIQNTLQGVEGELEGSAEDINCFLTELQTSPPPLSRLEEIDVTQEGLFVGYPDFSIRESRIDGGFTLLSPDICTCPECEKELYTPSDRRYRYPFINCTNCGPRYTIIDDIPYDRIRTSMQTFSMCADCENEYTTIQNRRYHAQPDCCPACGPHVFYMDSTYRRLSSDPFQAAQEALREGKILAVKGLGGFHLACDARNEDAVQCLRQRKHRASKPLALMCRSVETAREFCILNTAEEKLLTDIQRPILLLRKKQPALMEKISSTSRLGIMLPYTPLHILLLDGMYGGPDSLVMTSANLPGCPVMLDNEEALCGLSGIADGYLLHNRPIRNRCDDSLIIEWKGNPYFFRRSRGFTPQPVLFDTARSFSHSENMPAADLSLPDADGIFALGAEQKASFALGKEKYVFCSPHIGDLKNAETLSHYRETFHTFRRLFRLKPALLVCDLHPDYLSTQEAFRLSAEEQLPLLQVQHHWAHMASCMADNHLHAPCFGIIWDGMGLGDDESIWGAEFLEGDFTAFQRTGTIRPVPLPGGDRATQEIARIALGLLLDAGIQDTSYVPLPLAKITALSRLIESGLCQRATSMGRLFDGIGSLLLQKDQADYEGEAAVLTEALSPYESPAAYLASKHMHTTLLSDLCYPLEFYNKNGLRIFDTRPLIRALYKDLEEKTDKGLIAFRFMYTLCQMALEQCCVLNPKKLPVVLSGGVFQNHFLLCTVTELLEQNGFTVYTHRHVSPNDEGICLGQLAIAAGKKEEILCV